MAVNKNNWQSKMLVELCDFLSRGKSPKYADDIPSYPVFAQKCNLKEGGISLDNVRFLDPETVYKWQDHYKLQDKDIVINSTGNGTVGRVGLFRANILGQYPFIVPDSHVTVARMKGYCDSAFFYYCLKSQKIQKYFEDNLQGSTNQTELYIKTVKETFVLVPPLSEQQAIAEELDGIQSMIGKCREQLEDYDRLARSIFHEMFGDPVRNDKRWEVKTLREIFINRDSERVPLPSTYREEHKGVYDYYGACGVIDNIDDYIFDEKLLLIGEDGANLVTCSKPNAIIASGKYWVNNHAHVLQCTNCVDIVYACFAFNYIDISSYITGVAQPKLNQSNLNKIPIPLPPLPLQQQFATRIEAIEKMKEATKAQLADLQQLFDSRMQYYFS